jgi:hypothetical protein
MGLSPSKELGFSPFRDAERISEERLVTVLAQRTPPCANCSQRKQVMKPRSLRVTCLHHKDTLHLSAIFGVKPSLAELPSTPPSVEVTALALSQRLTDFTAGESSDP